MGQKDLSGRLARWSLKLQAFDFDIEYRKGSQNIVPDALSRVYMEELQKITIAPEINLEDMAFKESEYKERIRNFEEHSEKFPDICVSDGYIYIRTDFYKGEPVLDDQCWKLWVPTSLTPQLIRNAHEPPNCAHGGIGKTLQRLRQKYYWGGMAKEVKAFVSMCEICKRTKASNKTQRPLMGEQTITERPFQRLYVDFLGPYPRSKTGNTVVLVVVDHFTKFTFIKPLRAAKCEAMVKYIEECIFNTFGVPEYVHSDNGQQFRSKVFERFLGEYGVKHIRTAVYSPQANVSERVNRSLLAAIRAYISVEQSDWDKYISLIACSIRSSIHEAIKTEPYHAVFGSHMILHGSAYPLLRKFDDLMEEDMRILLQKDKLRLIRDRIMTNLSLAHEKGKKIYNTRARP